MRLAVLFVLCFVALPARAQEDATRLAVPRSAREPGRAPRGAPAAPAAAAPSVAAGYGVDPGDERETRRAVLENHLLALANRRSNRVGDGLVPILIGGTYIGLGVVANRSDERVGRYLTMAGTLSVVSGALYFGLSPNPGRVHDEFLGLYADPAAQVRFGERALRNASRKRMASRYLQGSLQLTTTLASLPLLFGGDGLRTDDPYDWVILTTASIGIIDAITTVFRRSEEERRYRSYQTRFPASHLDTQSRRSTAGANRDFRIVPVAGGGFFLATSSF